MADKRTALQKRWDSNAGQEAKKAFEQRIRRDHPAGWRCSGCGQYNTCRCPGSAWTS